MTLCRVGPPSSTCPAVPPQRHRCLNFSVLVFIILIVFVVVVVVVIVVVVVVVIVVDIVISQTTMFDSKTLKLLVFFLLKPPCWVRF